MLVEDEEEEKKIADDKSFFKHINFNYTMRRAHTASWMRPHLKDVL